MLISDTILDKYPSLSAKRKHIADYLLKNEDEICFKTLKEISLEIAVTEVTFINFCKAMGFQSFVEFKEQYRKEMHDKFSPTRKIFQSISWEAQQSDLFKKIINQQFSNHQTTMYKLNESELEAAANLISQSHKIYIICKGLSEIVGSYLKLTLNKLCLNAELIDLSRMDTTLSMKMLKFTKNDLFIFIAYPVYSPTVLKFCEYFRSNNFNIIGITDSEKSPITKYADVTFFSNTESLIFYNSIHCAISIVEVLSAILHQKLGDKLLGVQKDVETIEKEFSEFFNI